MSGRRSSEGRAEARFFVAEDCGEFAVLRFGPRVPERATDLEETRRLWAFLAGRRRSLSKKGPRITSALGGLLPATVGDFLYRVCAIKRSMVASADNLGAYLDQIGAGFRAIAESPADGMR